MTGEDGRAGKRKPVWAGWVFLLIFQCCWAVSAWALAIEGWTLQENRNYPGNLELAGGTLDLNGKTLTVTGHLIHSGGKLRIHGGALIVQGDYRLQSTCTTTQSGYCQSSGSLEMTQAADRLTVQRNFVIESDNRNSALSAGTLEIQGNFVQFAPVEGDSRYNFSASGEHMTILSGNSAQSVFFTSGGTDGAHFAQLVLRNASTDGISFISPVVALTSFAANSSRFALSNPAQSSLPGYSTAASGPTLNIVGPTAVASGGRLEFSANVTSSGGTATVVRPTWSASPAATASIGADGVFIAGQVSADARVLVSAAYTHNGTSLTASRIVTIASGTPGSSALISLNLVGPALMQGGGRLSLMAQAVYEDGSTRTVIPTWTSSNPTAAIVNDSGTIFAGFVNADTSVTVTARHVEGTTAVSASLQVKIQASRAALSSLTLTGPEHMQAGGRMQLTTNAIYADDSRRPVQAQAWQVSDAALGTVDARGFLKVGTVTQDTTLTVTASYQEGNVGKTASLTVQVHPSAAALSHLTIVGARGALGSGDSMNLTAEGRYSDGSRRTINAEWSLSDSGIARITSDGKLTAGTVSTETPLRIRAQHSEGNVTRRADFQTMILPAVARRSLLAEVEATGETDSYSLSVWFNTNTEASTTRASTTYNVYVAALLPAGPLATSPTFYMLNRSSTWQTLAWPLAEYLSGVEADSWELIEIIDSIDAALIQGTQIYVGYGTSSDEMMAAERYQLVYQVP